MREIKFRIWYPKSKKMVLWSEVIGLHISTIFQKDSEFQRLMQFTGLKDKNGVEIYEGDIVKLGDWSPKIIEYGNNGFLGFGLKNTEMFLSEYDAQRIEIIGNIYENPELLTKGKKLRL